ncbi:16S rRNA (guanine(966)-N(2))-methyltransferase RsmD [Chromatiales bacterium (ex Bugula neritina AB1)]|nr:16S rRNA (guanine(966)-N(2))-methyltransferase RsmD [Chromatiales bacterium (ex Bugula neritina AB1)]
MAKNRRNQVRIIAGSLRGRMVNFGDASGLRPTGNRLRETLFSWLQAEIPESCCLDMFAGSGVLGFEAISRGANEVILLERDATVCRQLRDSVQQLGVKEVQVHCLDSTKHGSLPVPRSGFYNIVFIDPPFAENLHDKAIINLAHSGLLGIGAVVVVESDARSDSLPVPAGWSLIKNKVAGEVRLSVYRIENARVS